MKAKVLVVALCVMMGLAAFSIGTANAALAYYTCTISAAGGINNDNSYVIVTDTLRLLPISRLFWIIPLARLTNFWPQL